jgi:uncharacterized UPF0160 family protein
MNKIVRLITHSGAFHADDVFAGSLLGYLFTDTIIRTRDEEIIQTAGADTIVFDVGNAYDPAQGRFDHHQIDKPLREDGLAYSSFGLVWKHFGHAYIRKLLGQSPAGIPDEQDIEKIHTRLDQDFVRDIDAVDNGQIQPGQEGALHSLSITSMLMDLRPDFDTASPDAMDHHYALAREIYSKFLAAKVRQAAAGLRSRKIVEDAIAKRVDPRWIELPYSLDYRSIILEAGDAAADILFVVNPAQNEWHLNTINVAMDTFDIRKKLPASWAGLRNAELASVTGVEDAVFAHTGRFFACTRSRDGIMRFLQQALGA